MRVAKDVFDPRFADHGCPRIVLDRFRLAADHHNTAARTQSFEHRLGRLRAAGGFENDINTPAQDARSIVDSEHYDEAFNPSSSQTHFVELQGLPAGTDYYFQLGTCDDDDAEIYTATTVPLSSGLPGNNLVHMIGNARYDLGVGQPVATGAIVVFYFVHQNGTRSSSRAGFVHSQDDLGLYQPQLSRDIYTEDLSQIFTINFAPFVLGTKAILALCA